MKKEFLRKLAEQIIDKCEREEVSVEKLEGVLKGMLVDGYTQGWSSASVGLEYDINSIIE